MAENKFSLDSLDPHDLHSGGINDLPELAVEIRPDAEKARSAERALAVSPAPEKNHQIALAIEESLSVPARSTPAPAPSEPPSKGFLGLVRKVRSTLPIIAKVLPLLDSGVAAALAPVASALTTQPTVNTKGIERSISEVQLAQRELRTNLQNHTLQLKRVDEQLVRIREEADQNFKEQQEKIEQVRSAIGTIKVVGIVSLVLLLVAIGLEGWILLQRMHVG